MFFRENQQKTSFPLNLTFTPEFVVFEERLIFRCPKDQSHLSELIKDIAFLHFFFICPIVS